MCAGHVGVYCIDLPLDHTSLCATSVFYWDQNWTEANAVSSISCTLMIQEPAIACTDASVFEVLSDG